MSLQVVTGSSYSNKVFAADLNASVAGVYDLYRKGNASAGTPLVQAEVADGSVTMAKFEPQLRADLNRASPLSSFWSYIGESLWDLGTPITGRTYTVPSGKVLVITSSGSYVSVHAARFHNT